MKEWRKLAQEKNVAVIIVTHSNKRENTQDPFDKVSGTTGLTGACDTVLVLEALSKKNVDFSLYVRGNDVEMADYALTFNNGVWTCEGGVEECIASDKEREVLDLFDFEDTIRAKLIHEKLDISYDYAKKLLKRLSEKGLVVRSDRGLYRRS